MSARQPYLRWGAWAGMAAPPIAWAVHHQLGSDLNYANCHVGGGVAAVTLGLVCLAVALGGGAVSVLAWREADALENPAGRFLGLIGLMVSALFSLTLVFQIGAGVIVPACFR